MHHYYLLVYILYGLPACSVLCHAPSFMLSVYTLCLGLDAYTQFFIHTLCAHLNTIYLVYHTFSTVCFFCITCAARFHLLGTFFCGTTDLYMLFLCWIANPSGFSFHYVYYLVLPTACQTAPCNIILCNSDLDFVYRHSLTVVSSLCAALYCVSTVLSTILGGRSCSVGPAVPLPYLLLPYYCNHVSSLFFMFVRRVRLCALYDSTCLLVIFCGSWTTCYLFCTQHIFFMVYTIRIFVCPVYSHLPLPLLLLSLAYTIHIMPYMPYM
jgi:hypothetical protein